MLVSIDSVHVQGTPRVVHWREEKKKKESPVDFFFFLSFLGITFECWQRYNEVMSKG